MSMDAHEILDREFLEVRARILDVAAALDRLDRASGSVASDVRRQNIDRAIERLSASDSDRAASVQLLFSRDYDPQWRVKTNSEFGIRNPE